jgi:hypothetical protein
MPNDFVDELASFPNGAHDDMVDSATQALNYLREGAYSGAPFFEVVERVGPVAQLHAVLAGWGSSFRSWGGFAEQRPILPQAAYEMSPAAAEASARIAQGNSRPDDIDKVMWSSLGDL